MINLQKQKFYKRRKNMKFVHIADMHFDTAFTTLEMCIRDMDIIHIWKI